MDIIYLLSHDHHWIDKNQAAETFRLFSKYTPESKDAKKERVEKIAAAKAKEEEKKPEVEEEDANDSDSEEVACQEITVDGKVYLLDPETMKVYARESPNGFVGKYDGSKIDHDAEDSDAESDDEE